MDIATLLTGTKWEIIELISHEPLSPLELSKKLNTTIANISQQLRLLQAAGIVSKQRTGSGKPGKPRMLFSISADYALITVITPGFAQKKMVKLNQRQKEVVKALVKES